MRWPHLYSLCVALSGRALSNPALTWQYAPCNNKVFKLARAYFNFSTTGFGPRTSTPDGTVKCVTYTSTGRCCVLESKSKIPSFHPKKGRKMGQPCLRHVERNFAEKVFAAEVWFSLRRYSFWSREAFFKDCLFDLYSESQLTLLVGLILMSAIHLITAPKLSWLLCRNACSCGPCI